MDTIFTAEAIPAITWSIIATIIWALTVGIWKGVVKLINVKEDIWIKWGKDTEEAILTRNTVIFSVIGVIVCSILGVILLYIFELVTYIIVESGGIINNEEYMLFQY